MDVHKVKLVVVKSGCELYKTGDEIVFDGPVIQKEKSSALCRRLYRHCIRTCLQHGRGLFGSRLYNAQTVRKRYFLR